MLVTDNVLQDLRKHDDFRFHTIFTDVPYNLGSSWIISDRMPEIKGRARDFMGKWEGLGGAELSYMFMQFHRILKHGGYCVMYGLDRQLFAFQYYAVKAGFEICQSLYWFNIASYPKATDAAKALDNRLGSVRPVVGRGQSGNPQVGNGENGRPYHDRYKEEGGFPITAAASEIAKQYEGYKYGIAPLKSCCETIMVFRKPTLSDTVVEDILLTQTCDTVSPAVLNIEAGRVPLDGEAQPSGSGKYVFHKNGYDPDHTGRSENLVTPESGRYPAQLFVSPEAAAMLDDQSGELRSGKPGIHRLGENRSAAFVSESRAPGTPMTGYGDTGGASRILHTIRYDEEEHEIMFYEKKVGDQERHAGLPEDDRNIHPTLKPIELNFRIAQLFKLPDFVDQQWYNPFSGVGSERIGIMKAGVKLDNIYCVEKEEQYNQINDRRTTYWADVFASDKARAAIIGKQEKLF